MVGTAIRSRFRATHSLPAVCIAFCLQYLFATVFLEVLVLLWTRISLRFGGRAESGGSLRWPDNKPIFPMPPQAGKVVKE